MVEADYTGPSGPASQVGLGVIAPYDFVLDRELWRWTPDSVSLHLTRTPFVDRPVSLEMASTISNDADIRAATRNLVVTEAPVIAYACTSASFVHGIPGESRLRATISEASTARAVTTSGALLAAVHHLGIRSLSVATPYVKELGDALVAFLGTAGVNVTGTVHLGLDHRIWTVPYARSYDLIEQADHPDADAIFVSCTNLPTYDLIAPAEARLGKPILTASQVTMWAALRELGVPAVGPGQTLLGNAH